MPLQIFTASFATETNTFSPVPTDRSSFEMAFYAGPGQHPATPTLCSSPRVVLRKRVAAEGIDLVEGTATWAEPGGLFQRAAYEGLRDEILGQLRAALPVDGVILGLHGAMVAQGYDDCEGDLLERVRAIVGPKVVIAAELDPHSHLTPKRVTNADILESRPPGHHHGRGAADPIGDRDGRYLEALRRGAFGRRQLRETGG